MLFRSKFAIIRDKSVTAVFAYTVLVGFADAVTVAEDSIQEHSWPQIVSCYFFRYRGRFFKIAH